LSLLRTAYKAKRIRWETEGYASIVSSSYMAETLDDYEQENRIKINENTLIKYGFDDSDFWEIICPSLKEEGHIEDFGNPNHIPINYYKRFLGFEELQKKLEDEQKIKYTDEEIKKTEKEFGRLLAIARNLYPFFVVNEDKLLTTKPAENPMIIPPIKKGKGDATKLFLNKVGDLWRKPKDKYCYQMDEDSDRHKIIRYLATNNGFQRTKSISSALNNKSVKSIRTDVGKIRKNIKKFLKLEGNKVLGSKKGSGYRIEPLHTIVIKNNND